MTGSENQVNPLKIMKLLIHMAVWRLISAADGDRCAMTPSCSAYAVESIKKYGFLEGYLMTCDRLIRCGRDELNISPIIKSGDDRLCLTRPMKTGFNNLNRLNNQIFFSFLFFCFLFQSQFQNQAYAGSRIAL